MKRFSIVLLWLAPLASIAQESAETLVNRVVQPYLAATHHRGLIVGIVQEGKQQFFPYGEVTAGSYQAPEPTSLFEIGELTEVFTTALLAEQVMQGQLNTDDPLSKLFPAHVRIPAYSRIACEPEKWVLVSDGEGEVSLPRNTRFRCIPANLDQTVPILLCDLATHTTGLPSLNRLRFWHRKNPYAAYQEADLYHFLNGFEFGKPAFFVYRYSPLNMALLGLGLSRKAGESFETLLAKRLATPLGLPDTRFSLSSEQQQRLLPGHRRGGRQTPHWQYEALAPAGGLHSTATDLLQFTSVQLGFGPSDWYFTLASTHNPRYPVSLKKHPNSEAAFGWLLTPLDEGGTKVIWRQGLTGGFCAFVGFVKETNTGVVILSNTARPVDPVGFELLRNLHQQLMAAQSR